MNKQELIQRVLKFLAKKVLKKYKPKVIAITGSVGKSTAKEMIYRALTDGQNTNEKKKIIWKSEKNYNNEIGIPLAILGVKGEKKSFWQWVGVVSKAIYLIIFPIYSKYPNILVLEFGADKPGDIKYFCDFIPVDVGVVTNVGISHLENFGSQKKIFQEKIFLLKSAKNLQVANIDGVKISKNNLFKNLQTYGIINQTDFCLRNIGYNYTKDNFLQGMIFELEYKGKVIAGKLNQVLGYPYLYGVLSALVVSHYFKYNLTKVSQALENIPSIPGHMSILNGIKHTRIIDDTYNSAPASVKEALRVVKKVDSQRKIIVLGDMLELGKLEKGEHKLIGKKMAEIKNSILVAVGDRMRVAFEKYREIIQGDDESRAYWFQNSIEAGRWLQDFMRQGDLILVKGSQRMRMEKIVEEIMAEPNKKKQLLVRQNKDWK